MKKAVSFLLAMCMTLCLLPMSAKASSFDYYPAHDGIIIDLMQTASNSMYLNHYAEGGIEDRGGLALFQGKSCHIGGTVICDNVTDIAVWVEKRYVTPGPYGWFDGQPMSWTMEQAKYKGTNTAVRVEEHYSKPKNVNMTLLNSNFDNGIKFGNLDLGYYWIYLRVKTSDGSIYQSCDEFDVIQDPISFLYILRQ